MGVRELVNQNRHVTIGVLVAVIVLVLAWIIYANRSDDAPPSPGEHKAWFTLDDGKTWFADDARRIPPFDHQGRQAVRCFVYSCGHGKQFVSHLLRYTPEGKKMQEQLANQRSFDPSQMAALQELTEIKPPNTGDAKWIRRSNPRAAQLEKPMCPEGSDDQIVPVEAIE